MALTRNILTIQDLSSLDFTCDINGLRIDRPTLVDNADGTFSLVHPDGVTNLGTVAKADLTDNGNGSFTFTNNDGSDVTIFFNNSTVTQAAGNQDADVTAGDARTIATHNDGDGNLVTINETVTGITDNGDGTYTYTNEAGATALIQGGYTQVSVNGTTNAVTFTYPNGTTVSYDETLTQIQNTVAGNKIADYTNEDGTVVDINETITSLSYNVVGQDGTLTYVDEAGVTTTINLIAENFLSSGSYDPDTNILTLTMVDGSTITVNMADLVDNNSLQVADTNCIDMNISGTGTVADPWVITASPIISAAANNLLECTAGGLFVDATLGELTNVDPDVDTAAGDCDLLAWDAIAGEWTYMDMTSSLNCAGLTP